MIINWNLDSEILWITNTFPLKYYGLLFVTGLLTAHYVVKKFYILESVPVENLDKLLSYIVVGTILGARLGHCFFMNQIITFKIQLKYYFL